MTDPALWGIAMTAAGSEGLSDRSDWSTLTATGTLRDSMIGNGFGFEYRSDLPMLAEAGIPAMRWTLDWSRLEPRPGQWDSDAVDHTTDILQTARTAGIEVWAVLHDGPLPGWFSEDQRGFDDADGLRLTWPRHVDRVAETFGDLVAGWVPILDPYTRALEGHLVGTRPPHKSDPGSFLEALQTLHRASFEANRLLRSGDPLVAVCIDTCPVEPGVMSREPDERDAAQKRAESVDRLRFGSWIRELNDGVISIPGLAEIEIDGLAGAYDLIGFTYRGGSTLFADGTSGPYPLDAAVAADGRAPWTEGLGVTIRRLADNFPGRKFALLGTGLTANEDDWRAETLSGSLLETQRAADDGIVLTHAFWESGIDGWTPESGFEVADGVFDRNRNPRASAQLLRATPR
jgi:beta-glucosidase